MTTVTEPPTAGPRVSTYAYDTDGKVTGITNPLNQAPQAQWSSDFQVTKVIEPTGKYTEYAYNANGYLTDRWDQPRNHTLLEYENLPVDANGNPMVYASYDANGLPTTITDAENQTTTFGYDDDGLLRWVQDAMHQQPPNGVDAHGYRAYFYYDSFHRLGKQSAPKATAGEPGTLIWSAASYDANDNLTLQIGPHYGTSYGDQGGGTLTTTSYDAMDRRTAVNGPYNPGDTTIPQTEYAYDEAGRLVQAPQPRGMAPASPTDDFATIMTYATTWPATWRRSRRPTGMPTASTAAIREPIPRRLPMTTRTSANPITA